MANVSPYIWGVGAVACLWAAIALVTWSANPKALILGKDLRPSSSKLQFLLWTAATLFAYVTALAVAIARSEKGWSAAIEIPGELLAVMGVSSTTFVAAKAITASQVANGSVAKPAAPDNGALSSVVTNDCGDPELVKAQMLAWTFVALIVFLVRVCAYVNGFHAGTPLRLPGIETSLVALTGIGNAAYLGKKIASTDQIRISGITPASGRAPLSVTITGVGFGCRDGAAVTLDSLPITVFPTAWCDNRIELTLPAVRPDGQRWPTERAVAVGVVSNGRIASNTVPFTFAS